MSETNGIQFDQLPFLAMQRIFESLSLQDLVNCRRVNRQLRFYLDGTEIDELVVSGSRAPCRKGQKMCKHWYQTGRPINFKRSIYPSEFASMKATSLNFDQHLKYLHIHLACVDINIEILNGLQQLAHLEINCGARSEQPKTLTLPNLKVFNVRAHHNFRHNWFNLNTPKLEVLTCEELGRIRVYHPSVQLLVCDNRNPEQAYEDLYRFQLAGWEGLKELQILTGLDDFFGYLENTRKGDPYRLLKTVLLSIMRAKSDLEREELKVYLDEVQLVDEQLDFFGSYQTAIQERRGLCKFSHNHHHLWFKYHPLLHRDSYPQLKAVNFNHLMHLNVELSSAFFDRFPAIERLTAFEKLKRDQFEWFLSNATELREMNLKYTSLEQAFMERLPSLSSRLTHLTVDEKLVTDFDFILQFEHLKVFKTGQQLPALFDLAAKAFVKLKELSSFHFKASGGYVEIERSPTNKYVLFYSRTERQTYHRNNLQWPELADFYQRITNVY